MLCPRCGQTMADSASWCPRCGHSALPETTSAPREEQPLFTAVEPPTSSKAIASLILGLFFFLFFAAIPAIVLGHLALSEIKASAGGLRGRGLAIAGLVLGYFGLGALAVGIFAGAFFLPRAMRSDMISINERAAVNNVRYLGQAERSYAVLNPKTGYACDFQSMIDAGVLDAKTVRTARFGYALGLQKCGPAAKGGPNVKYQLVAYPVQKGTTGRRMFCADESGVVKANLSLSPDDCLQRGTKLP